ncbi:MAG TPA: four helix bundle protein [Phycisphaerae bacterium]|nr:four helix bundle protein [Phycisphaerae bacterium]HOJ73008.1 four helix bundle protein [Phycisphaerae bacterium]HOM50192.1 four helix bundle protein [Phycisphaerae bacterium]HON67040.1 four helix bundle protein [Phycisphaerae bacterium]HOQ87295.1 four helix bundle protein [Phycisphaerae bacterium]
MARTDFEERRVYRSAEKLADEIWDMVAIWDPFAKATVGEQVVDAADSVGANIAEDAGRGSYQQNRHFVRIARGSLYEAKHFLRRAYRRKLVDDEQAGRLKPILDELAPSLNAYLRSIGSRRRDGDAADD